MFGVFVLVCFAHYVLAQRMSALLDKCFHAYQYRKSNRVRFCLTTGDLCSIVIEIISLMLNELVGKKISLLIIQ